jgi:hypothetical protein
LSWADAQRGKTITAPNANKADLALFMAAPFLAIFKKTYHATQRHHAPH